MSDLKQTPLHALHLALGAKMVPFAGYDMPVQYALGVMKEHLHTRAKAGLFDVSHMGQVIIQGRTYEAAARGLETLIPVDVLGLADNRQRYGVFTNADGGIEDDLMLANRGDHVFAVVNAACKAADIARMKDALEPDVTVTEITNRALLALQGPAAEQVLSTLNARVADMAFMDVASVDVQGVEAWISRSGYTGEDGYEISVPADAAEAIAKTLLDHPDVAPIGLGARDSLRLEAGLCLYGHDIDATTTPVEAGLTWAIQKVRRADGARAGGFPGAARTLEQMAHGAARKRVGLRPTGRAPMREGVALFASEDATDTIGAITSGGFGPTIGGPVAMGYVGVDHARLGTPLFGELRGKRHPLTVAQLPFTPANFKR
ncbi:glycine cleavage system aminomethyltransferase GcvT [Tateyamaria sp. SN3-11]|uniref:glycine cleavage system aminomethyltransferase GcvT n=1 Tax=Tateyamaria sp. SN3-11 TaxID=3092147 RepID=UPI0039E7E8A5